MEVLGSYTHAKQAVPGNAAFRRLKDPFRKNMTAISNRTPWAQVLVREQDLLYTNSR
jgi:hypothetical protein